SPRAHTAGVLSIALLFALAAIVVWRRAPRTPTPGSIGRIRGLSSLPPPSLATAGAMFSLPPPLRALSLAPPPDFSHQKPVTHADSIRFVFRDRAFRAVASFGLINGSAHSVIAYVVLSALERSEQNLAAQYGILRFAEPITVALVPAIVAPAFIRRAGIRGTFIAPAVAILVAVAALAISDRPWVVIAIEIVTNVAFGLEYAGFAASLTEIPERLRARTSVLLEGTVYHLGYIAGVALLVASAASARIAGHGSDAARAIALAVTFALSLLGLQMARRFRARFGGRRAG
ncbi:MAG TPA: hypothetical protein VJW75_06955, partial [Candidatus Eisenbacteria bacterium]|nr:hypothetical protein [Candidatus Eisenbacteria bacterium]